MSSVQELKKTIIEGKIASLKAKLPKDSKESSEGSGPTTRKRIKREVHEEEEEEQAVECDVSVNETDDSKEDISKEKDAPQTAKDLFSVFRPESDSEGESDAQNQDSGNENAAEDKEDKNKQLYRRKKFKKEWESIPSFKHWISASVHGNTYFYCKFCKKDYRCGKSELIKHMGSKKHQRLTSEPVTRVQRKFAFRGLLCPAITIFENKRQRDINYSATKSYGNFLKTCGIKGVLINDVLGEGTSLTVRERMHLTETWADICERNSQFLMVQVGGAPLVDVIEMVKHAEQKKVGAIVLMADLYSRPKNHLDIIKYIKIISEVSKDLPILFHHCPNYLNFDMNVTQFLLDISGEIESFVGIIYSTDDVQKALSALNVNEDKFTVFLGTDELIIAGVATGFSCIMSNSLNLFAKLVQAICNSVHKGEIKTAHLSQKVLHKALDRIYIHGDLVSTLKAAMSIVTPISAVATRPPLDVVWEGTLRKMTADLQELAVI